MAAPEGNQYAVGNEGGRPTKYKDEYSEQAYKLCLLGATDKELADFFDVAESTINEWKLNYNEFSEALKSGKTVADTEVANKLFKRATGAIIIQEQAIKVKEIEFIEGKKVSEIERVEVVQLQQEQPPDTTAGIFWLKNRKSDKWRDKVETQNTNTNYNSVPLTKEQIKEINEALENDY